MAILEALRWAWKFRRFFAIGLLLLVFVWLWNSKTSTERDLAEEKLRNAELLTLVNKQNATIKDWQKTADATMEYAAQMRDEANKKSVAYNKKAQRILVEKPVRDDECAATLELLRKYQ
jgi:hypothetical protein